MLFSKGVVVIFDDLPVIREMYILGIFFRNNGCFKLLFSLNFIVYNIASYFTQFWRDSGREEDSFYKIGVRFMFI